MKGETQTSFKYRGNYSYGLKNLTLKATRKKILMYWDRMSINLSSLLQIVQIHTRMKEMRVHKQAGYLLCKQMVFDFFFF